MSGGAPSKTIGSALVAVALIFLLATPALAVDGFDQLKFGMSPDEVRAAYPDQIVHDPKPSGAPDGSVGGRLVLTGEPKIFDSVVEVSCFFTASGLSTIRLLYRAPDPANVDKLLEWYRPHWGEPLRSVRRDRSRKKVTWVWPWEGVEFRSVEDEGKTVYQRVDFSEEVKTSWTRADAVICKLLPGSSSCPFPDNYCAQQDSTMPTGQRTQRVEIADRSGEASCTYDAYTLKYVRLQMPEPSDKAVDWLEAILARRLGPGVEKREGDSARVKIDTVWEDHGVELRVVRKARVKTDKGWTGPAEYLRLKRKP
jgi:hypothetical protein